jgi:iron-sulfur cluster repair protein YtfE (RIC family)
MTQAIVPEEEPVSVALELHHRRLDDLLDRVEIDIEAGDWSEARRRFSLFRQELDEHVRIEEDLLFPSLESPGRPGAGESAVMRAEHAEIRRLLDMLEELLEDGQPIGEATDMLEVMLAAHHAKEERVLYPMFERLAPPEAYAALASELRPLLRVAQRGPTPSYR